MTKLTKEQQKSTSRVFDANNISNPKLLQLQINSKTVMSQLKSAENKNVQLRAKKKQYSYSNNNNNNNNNNNKEM